MSAQVTAPITTVTLDELQGSIANYKQQSEVISQQLAQLEANKAVALKTLDMLSGAVQALGQVVENIKNAEAARVEAEKKAAEEAAYVAADALATHAEQNS